MVLLNPKHKNQCVCLCVTVTGSIFGALYSIMYPLSWPLIFPEGSDHLRNTSVPFTTTVTLSGPESGTKTHIKQQKISKLCNRKNIYTLVAYHQCIRCLDALISEGLNATRFAIELISSSICRNITDKISSLFV